MFKQHFELCLLSCPKLQDTFILKLLTGLKISLQLIFKTDNTDTMDTIIFRCIRNPYFAMKLEYFEVW